MWSWIACARRAEYIVAKHGKPVAKLVPCDPAKRPKKVFGSMRGSARIHVETFTPAPRGGCA